MLLANRGSLPLAEIQERAELSERTTANIVNLLEEAMAVSSGPHGIKPKRSLTPELAAQGAFEVAEDRQRVDESRIAMIRSFAETLGCRRQFLLGYFGEQLSKPCGNCDTCDSGTAYKFDDEARTSSGDQFPLEASVRHSEWGIGTVMRTEDDRITVFFETEGYRVLSREAIAERHLLELVS